MVRLRAVVAAGIGAVLAVSSVSLAPAASAETVEDAVLRIINGYRASGVTCVNEAGSPLRPAVPPLTGEPRLSQAAANHSTYMALNDVVSHDELSANPGFTGREAADRVEYAGYVWVSLGENIAAATATPVETVNAWLRSSSGHCSAMMGQSYVQAGVGYVYSAATTSEHYWTLALAVPSDFQPTQIAPGSIDGMIEVTAQGESLPALSTLPKAVYPPLDAPWSVTVIPSTDAPLGDYHVQLWNFDAQRWDNWRYLNMKTHTGALYYWDLHPILIELKSSPGHLGPQNEVRLRTVVVAPNVPGVSTAGPVTSLRFRTEDTPTTIRIDAYPPRYWASFSSGTFMIGGSITTNDPDLTVPVGGPVAMECQKADLSWGACSFDNGSATIKSPGVWTAEGLPIPTDGSVTMRARLARTGDYLPSVSEPVTMTFTEPEPEPDPVATLRLTGPSDAAWGSYPTLAGISTGIPSGRSVIVEHLFSGAWYGWDNAPVADGAFTYTLDFPVSGPTTWRVAYPYPDGTTVRSDPFTVNAPTSNPAGPSTGTPVPVPTNLPVLPGAPPLGSTPSPGSTTGGGAGTTPTDPSTLAQIPITVKRSTVKGVLAKMQVRTVALQRLTAGGVWRTVKVRKTSTKTGKVKFAGLKKRVQYRLYAPQRTFKTVIWPEAHSRTFTR